MTLKFPLLILSILVQVCLWGQQPTNSKQLRATTNLNKVKDKQLTVHIYPPSKTADTLTFAMPKIIPGTYSISNFGNLVYDMAAVDNSGNTLPLVKLDDNRWQIAPATNLKELQYRVGATFSDPAGKHIFEPSGTQFEKDKVFQLNTFGLIGFFEELGAIDYHFEVTRPANFYGATALKQSQLNDSTDLFVADNYFDFHDSPILYAEPDTASFMIGQSEVQIALHSPSGLLDAQIVKAELTDIMRGAAEYLGGTLPVEKYVVLINLLQGMGNSGGFGALEHNFSTTVVMPEMSANFVTQQIRDIVAHEFFHIVTPLNIHSEHIHNYDFINPKMSKHLWLYEGSTEYSAHHMQVCEGIITPDEYLTLIRQKVAQASGFNDTLPFTDLSKGALDKHKNQYMNVYMKGSLIGMCLDILLCSESDGDYNLRSLMAELSEKYGTEKPFEDDSLFDEITAMTYPEVGVFFERYVAGTEPLPLSEYLSLAGVYFAQNDTITELTFGGYLAGKNDEQGKMEVVSTIGMNSFGKELGVKRGDLLISINDISLKPENFAQGIRAFKEKFKNGDKVTLVVERKNSANEYEAVKLKARAQEVERIIDLRISWETIPTEKQRAVRKAWINY